MIIVWGTIEAGRVDEVPKLFHVATRFGHVYYLPLIPLGSFAVFEKTASGFQGAKIPLSLKSVLVAWLRAASIIGGAGLAIFGCVSLANHATAEGIACFLASALAFGALFASYKLRIVRQASYDRAKHLAQVIGLSPMGLLMIEVAYQRLTPEQADRELARLEAAAERAETQS